MNSEESNLGRALSSYREDVLGSRSPQEFILDHVEARKRLHQNLVGQGYRTGDFSDFDLAELLVGDIASGIVTEQEMRDALPVLGFEGEKGDVFMETTIPEAMRLLGIKQLHTQAPYIRSIVSHTTPEGQM